MSVQERLKRLEIVTSKERRTNPHALAEKAGLPPSTIRNMLKKLRAGIDPNPQRATMEAIAKAANVSRAWLDGDDVPEGTYGSSVDSHPPTPTPPPASGHRPSIAELLREAYDHTAHDPGDVLVVDAAVKVEPGRSLLNVTRDRASLVRQLLDTAAAERHAKRDVSADVLVALTVERLRLERDEARRATPQRRPASQR